MAKNNINVAILGFGLSGSTFHAPFITTINGYKLTHILSRQAQKISALYPQVKVVDKIETILNCSDIDLIINTLPNSEHYPISEACLNAGKHVVVEKPFVIDSDDGLKLITLAARKNLILSVYHNRRWDNGFLTLNRHLNDLGKLHLYQAYFDRFRPIVNPLKWREQDNPGTGILYDLGSHLIDQAITLFGNPLAVFADLDIQRNHAVTTDYFAITLFYDKLRVVLGSSSIVAEPRPIIAAYGDKGSYLKYGLDPQEEQLKSGVLPTNPQFGVDKENPGILVLGESQLCQKINNEAGNYQQFYKQLYNSICEDSPPPVTANQALNVIKIIELCGFSSKQQTITECNL